MSKIRVYELAQQLKLENKVLVDRLKELGIDAKNHMSALEEADVQRAKAALAPSAATAAPATPAREAATEEVRVKSTLIRRRRVAESGEEAAPEVAAEPVVPVADAAAPQKETHKQLARVISRPEPPVVEPPVAKTATKPAEKPVVEKPAVEKSADKAAPAPAPAEAPEAAVAEPVTAATTEPTAAAAPADAAAKPAAAEAKPAAPQARILGRVQIFEPKSVPRPAGRPGGRPDGAPGRRPDAGAAPGGAPGPRQYTPGSAPAPGAMPAPGADKKGGKKGPAAGKKGKDAVRKTDRLEMRERVFEPGPRHGKKKGGKGGREIAPDSRKTEITTPKAIKRIIKISESITVGELAKRMGVKATDLIRVLMKMGMMVTINHPLDVDTATLMANEFGYEIENVAIDMEEVLTSEVDAPESLQTRPPVVTIMGHVDHGKTSLLDAIRETNVIAGEAGGITQHIGAYDVESNGRKITFLDTPGHEAFTAMRARGAKVTDIVILVVAADDGVMPQTREAVNHAKAAGVPIIVAINKIDKPEAKPERVKQELMEFGLVAGEWGGDTTFVEVSAKKRLNLEELLEMVLLQADTMELKANPDKAARGTIIEAKLDRGRGPVATVLVQEGTLKVGDYCVVGMHYGRVRATQNDRGERLPSAGPSMPVEVIGLTGVPEAGDIFAVTPDERQAKEIANFRAQKLRETEMARHSKMSLEQLYDKIQQGEVKDLNVIVKADVQGSVEAVAESLRKLSTGAVRLNVIHTSVGAIIESDVNLASASNAIILGFNVRPESKASQLAEREGVDVRLYNVIYDAVEDIKKAMEGLLEPTFKEKYLGRAEVRDTFSVPKVGTVAGCYVLDGKIIRNSQVRLLRDNVVVYQGKLGSLRRFKDDVKEVASGYECGMSIENYNDLKVGDVIESFEMEKVATTL